jgi:hypothetical protein
MPNEIVKKFKVTLRFQHPAWDERDGIPYEIDARSKSEAIRWARLQANRDGHTIGCGRHWFKAEQVEADHD